MTLPTASLAAAPSRKKKLPFLVEDDHEVEMGESNTHYESDDILHNGVKTHLAGKGLYHVYSNMDLHYDAEQPKAYKTPDLMVINPPQPLPAELGSYQMDDDHPAPVFVAEVLSARTANRGDKGIKVSLYADLGIAEYLLVDITGRYLPERLLLKRLQPDGTWQDLRDPDGGVTSILGFRVIIDTDRRLRVLDAQTGKRYPRPDEAEAEAEKRRRAEERVRELEAELLHLQNLKANGHNGGAAQG